MRKLLLSLLTPAALLGSAAALDYKSVPDWYKLPEGRTQMGNMHGDIAVSSTGEVYVSVMDPRAALQVYAPDGKFLRNVPGAPPDFHGFVIHRDADGEFIYGARLGAGNILKLALDGRVVLDIPSTAIPDEFKSPGKDGKPTVRLTAMDVAPGGDLFVTDGYSSDYIHRFDKTGKYLETFGGKKEPYGFKTLHKIAIDTRFTPPRIIGCDRANGRVVHLGLDGAFLGVVATDLLLPAAVAIRGDLAVIGEIKGRITLLDRAGRSWPPWAPTPPPTKWAPTRPSPTNGSPASSLRPTAWPSTPAATSSSPSTTSTAASTVSTPPEAGRFPVPGRVGILPRGLSGEPGRSRRAREDRPGGTPRPAGGMPTLPGSSASWNRLNPLNARGSRARKARTPFA